MADIIILQFEEKHINAAISLFNKSYKETIKYFPMLPEKYMTPDSIIDDMKWIVSNHYGVVAMEDEVLVGYLLGMILPEFKCSNKGVYCPEWGHGTIKEKSDYIYYNMYKNISAKWANDGCVSTCITLLANQKQNIDSWIWNGFSKFVIDGARYLDQMDLTLDLNIEIKPAKESDINSLVPILKEHDNYMRSATTFLDHGFSNERNRLIECINDKGRIVWIVKYKEETVGIMNTKVDSDDACVVVQDKGTVSILTTHVLDKYKGLGIGKHMLYNVLEWGKDNNYSRCTVDFESANYEARRFWSKHFETVCVSLIRYIDDRLVKK